MSEKKFSPVDLAQTGFEIRRALVALEMGATDRSILQYLSVLIRLAPVERLSFLHVLPEPDFWDTLEKDAEQSDAEQNEAEAKALQDFKLRTLAALELREGVRTDFGIRRGSPLEELLSEAAALDADLIVTGLSTQRGAHGILAKTLARHSPCNTLIIPDLSKPAYAQILVPLDFSDNSAKALRLAVALNSQLTLPAKITCLHVYEVPDANWYRIQRTEDEIRHMVEKNRQEALRNFLKEQIPDYHDAIGTILVPKIDPGIGNYIIETAEKTGADLIMIGAKGHSHVERLLIGSVTEKVLALTTHVPVLVVK